MAADVLPGFSWSRQAGRYRDGATGKFVSRQRITALLDGQIRRAEARMADIVTAMHEQRLSPAYGQMLMRDELRRLHLQNRSLAVGGFDRLTLRDYGAVGGRIRDDYRRMAQLTSDIAQERVSLPQALNRVTGYVGNARAQFFEAEREVRRQVAAQQGMTLLMIRDLGTAEHCVDCVDYYRRGYQVDLPYPGERSRCSVHCRCGIRYREVPASEIAEWIGTRRAS